jgi:hypothetical protein
MVTAAIPTELAATRAIRDFLIAITSQTVKTTLSQRHSGAGVPELRQRNRAQELTGRPINGRITSTIKPLGFITGRLFSVGDDG